MLITRKMEPCLVPGLKKQLFKKTILETLNNDWMLSGTRKLSVFFSCDNGYV